MNFSSMRSRLRGTGPWMAGLLLCSGLYSGCASTKGAQGGDSATAQVNSTEVEAALAAHKANPGDKAASARLIRAYLTSHRYAEAYDAAQILREADPKSAEAFNLLGEACFGLGLFDQAAACFNAARELKPGDADATWWLAYVLAARGNTNDARQILMDAVDAGATEWRFYLLLLELTPSTEGQLTWLELYRQKSPNDDKAAKIEASLKERGEVGAGKMVTGAGEVIRVPMNDSYKVSARINGAPALLLFDTGASGLILSDDLATRIGLNATKVTILPGVGGVKEVKLNKLELGGMTMSDAPAGILQDLDLGPGFKTVGAQFGSGGGGMVDPDTGGISGGSGGAQRSTTTFMPNNAETYNRYDGVIGPDFLPGYSYVIDRKEGVLELYPPDKPLPTNGPKAVKQRYYKLGNRLVTDATVRNRISNKPLPTKMSVATDLAATVFNGDYARTLSYGKLNATTTTTVKEKGGYRKFYEVQMSEVDLAGGNFAFDRFWAGDVDPAGYFTPFGALGWDVLSRFKITLDTKQNQLIFELYEL